MTKAQEMHARTPITRALVVTLLVWLVSFGSSNADEKPTPNQPTKQLDPAKVSYFEKHVRPLLLDECMGCHSGDEPDSELNLESREAMLVGGLRGPAVTPSQPEKSLLIRAIRHGELLKMPPKRKLSTAQIATLAKWIKDGAVWPNSKATKFKPKSDSAVEFSREQKNYWAFQPVERPSLPQVMNRDWIKSPIDWFVLSRLEQAGYSPTHQASKRNLIRRITFDLIGLPPTPGQVQAFLADESPQAVSNLVERLLASPHYGERWGRHWLDVVRYADSNGLDENLCYGNAYRYRDYVIKSFNAGKSFDRLIHEQLAGDLIDDNGEGNKRDRIIATGFLCIGPKMLAEDDPVKMHMDIIDEQLDTLSRAFMGLTLGCARCHDHKFDPISTEDYYALAGILKSTHTMDTLTVVAKWHEVPLDDPAITKQISEIDSQIAKLDAQSQQVFKDGTAKTIETAKQHVGDYLVAAEQTQRLDVNVSDDELFGLKKERPAGSIFRESEDFDRGNVLKDTTNYGVGIGVLVNKGQTPNFVEYDIESSKAQVYRLELRLAAAASRPCKLFVNGKLIRSDVAKAVTGSWFPDRQKWFAESKVVLRAGKNVLRLEHPQYFPHIDKLLLIPDDTVKLAELKPVDNNYKPIGAYVTAWQELLGKIDDKSPQTLRRWKAFADKDDFEGLAKLATKLQHDAAEQNSSSGLDDAFAKLVADPNGPFKTTAETTTVVPESTRQLLAKLKMQKDTLAKSKPMMPHAMAVKDGKAENIRIHIRGSHLTQGKVVPRRFPTILSLGSKTVGEQVSGRKELAHWLTKRSHPLTARVFVNRVWRWHFGAALVRTPDNFGLLGEQPTHPELLDWLADEFVESGWSIKHLHRLILNSATYQQSVAGAAGLLAADPANRLWGRMNRRRLEAEAIRDSLLALSGSLEQKIGGTNLTVKNRAYVTSTANVNPEVYTTKQRSVYLPIVRSALFEVLQAFDFADPSVINGSRQTTTVAPQALFMMNSEMVANETKRIAGQLLEEYSEDGERLRALYWKILSREPTGSELARTSRFLELYTARWKEAFPKQASEATLRSWQAVSRSLFASNEFVFRD